MAYLMNPEDQDLLDSVREFCEKESRSSARSTTSPANGLLEIYREGC